MSGQIVRLEVSLHHGRTQVKRETRDITRVTKKRVYFKNVHGAETYINKSETKDPVVYDELAYQYVWDNTPKPRVIRNLKDLFAESKLRKARRLMREAKALQEGRYANR